MKANKEQPVQTIVTQFKKKGQRLFRLGQDYQHGVKKLVFTVVLMYQDMPDGETIRLNASAGEYEFDVKAEILQNTRPERGDRRDSMAGGWKGKRSEKV